MTDLSQTITPKSDQFNADDLIGGPRTVTVTRVNGNEGSAEQPINIYFEGDNGKPYRPCKSMRRVLVQVWGKDGTSYPGRSMTLYRDPEVQFGGLKVGGIRISHMSHIDKPMTMALTATRANRKPFTVQPLKVAPKAVDSDVDKAAEWAANRIAQIGAVADNDALETITQNANVAKYRAWLSENRPELATKVDDAIDAAVARFSGDGRTDDGFGDQFPEAAE